MKLFKKAIFPGGRKRLYICGIRVASWNANKRDKLELPRLTAAAIADPHGFGGLELKLWNLHVPRRFYHLFYKMPPDAVCIDCGANVGKFTDAVLHQGGRSYAFEPNAVLFNFLSRKYAGNRRVQLFKAALGASDGTAKFYLPADTHDNPSATYEDGSLWQRQRREQAQSYDTVQVMDFARFLKQEFGAGSQAAQPPIWLIKMDIEGSEFEVVERLITEQVYRLARHIVVETHEKFFSDQEDRLQRLRHIISEAGADNIELGWV
jgi:FkbM family methyltransferase